MPAGADTVFMQEDVRVDGDAVIVPPGLKRGANRRLAGEDVRAGSVVLPAGRRLAAAGRGARRRARPDRRSTVRRRVRVALFSTGDEIVEPGTPRPAAALYDANRYLLAGTARPPRRRASTDLGILRDDPDALAHALAAAARGPRSRADLRRRLDRRGRSCARRGRERRHAGVLARRHQAGPAGGDGRDSRRRRRRRRGLRRPAGQSGRRSFVTFARVVRPLLLRLAGAEPAAADARCRCAPAFAYSQEEGPARICARRACARRRRRRSRRSSIRRRAPASSPR